MFLAPFRNSQTMGTFPTSIDFLTDSWCGHRLQDKEMPAWMGFGTLKVFPNTVKGASHRASLILGFHLSEASRQATLGLWTDVLQQVQDSRGDWDWSSSWSATSCTGTQRSTCTP